MATIHDMAFDYSMQRGKGKKSYEHFIAGAKAVIREIQKAYEIRGIDTMVDQINAFSKTLNNPKEL
jgi:hypothetical protein